MEADKHIEFHIRELSQKNTALILTLSKTGLSPPPQIFGSSVTLFQKSKLLFFLTFWYKFVHPNSPNILAKSVSKFLDLVQPPPLSTKIQKMLVHKKCPKIFGLLWNGTETDFFSWMALLRLLVNNK